jgi:hypothetical protein
MMAPVSGKATYEAQIRPVLSALVEDSDRDVRFFASQTLKKMDTELLGSTN